MALNLKGTPTPVKAEPKTAQTGGLMEILAAIRKDKGDKVVIRGDQINIPRRLPTGIFELDFAIGGGFPCGRYSIVYGPESSCKTNVALKTVATAQRLPPPCNKAVWVNVEQSFDPDWAAKMGVKVNELVVVEAGYGEEAVDLIDALVRADDVAILVVDSVASLIANKEIGQSTENYDIGTSALLIKRMVNKLMIAFGESRKKNHDPCVILINQTRFKPGVMFGDPETMPGGEAQKFLSSLRVRFYAKNEIDKVSSTITFKDVHAVVKKAKVPVRTVSFDFKLCVTPFDGLRIGDTNSFSMVKGHLQALGFLEKVTQGYRLKLGKASIMFSTLSAMQEKYQTDRVFCGDLQRLVIDSYKDSLIFVEEPDPSASKVQPGVVQPIAK